MIPLIWYDGRCCWDQDIIDVIAPSSSYVSTTAERWIEDDLITDGGVLVIPARYFVEKVAAINAFIADMKWVVVMLTSDEESLFPWRDLSHPNMRIWIQSGRPDIHNSPDLRFFPVGAPDMSLVRTVPADRSQPFDVFFSGQITHARRDQMLAAMETFPNSDISMTTGFTKGFPRENYLRRLVSAKVAPAPSGPASADTFRCWEALECGVVPLVDSGPVKDGLNRSKDDYPEGFWNLLLGEDDSMVGRLSDWEWGPGVTEYLIARFPYDNNLMFSKYQQYKRQLRQRLLDDVNELSGVSYGKEMITVLIPTSCTPNNPDDSHLEATIAAIRENLDSEILIMFDQPHEKLAHRNADYQEYVRRVLWRCNHEWTNVVPVVYNEFLHQSEKIRRTLPMVRTPLVLFNEHDTPLQGDIDWSIIEPLLKNELDLIRFYHEVQIHPEHQHLMFERHAPNLIRTNQWSGRPHIARTDYYRSLMRHFGEDERIFIEWRMHGVAQAHPWYENRMALYAPEGEDSIQHSGHLDARGEDPTFEDELTR